MVVLGRAQHMMWAAASAVLADRFFTNVWRDWKHMRSRSSESTLHARILINAFVALYNVFAFCVDLCSDRSSDTEPTISFRLMVMTARVLNFAISVTMLHLYMHLSGCWTEQNCISGRKKWFVTISLVIFILLWSLADRGRSWYEEALWWSSQSQWDAYELPRLAICYYTISAFVDMGCCCVLWHMRCFFERQINTPDGERSDSRDLSLLSGLDASFSAGSFVSVSAVRRNTIQPVFIANVVVTCVTVMMTLSQFLRLDDEMFRNLYLYNGYGVLMFVLYTTRYALFYILAKPTNRLQENNSRPSMEHDVADALHCAPESYWRKYQFKRGKAMVICNSLYHESTGLGVLPDGSGGAAKSLGDALDKLGFDSSCQNNLRGDDIKVRFKTFVSEAGEDDHNCDGIALAYLGHGDIDSIIGVDGKTVKISEIIDVIMSEPLLQLRPKPKLLIFDCCRGAGVEIMRRSQVSVRNITLPPRMGFLQSRQSLHADFLQCFATADGFAAFNQEHGGLFSQTLMQRIDEFLARNQSAGTNALDILGLMTEVVGRVSEKRDGFLYKQAPQIKSSLTRKFEVSVIRPRASSSPV